MTLARLSEFAGLHPLAFAGLAALTVMILWTEIARRFTGYRALSPSGLTELINREDALVVDVSASADFDKGRIAGARNLPLAQFDPEHKLLKAGRERPVALVCRTGQGSATAAARLVKAGFPKVHWLEGGVTAWQQADLPLVKGKG
jgi:rhodanese-related sulfurtransferase